MIFLQPFLVKHSHYLIRMSNFKRLIQKVSSFTCVSLFACRLASGGFPLQREQSVAGLEEHDHQCDILLMQHQPSLNRLSSLKHYLIKKHTFLLE